MLRTLIIDDEKDARDALRILVQKFVQGVQIVGEGEGVQQGIEQIHRLQPDLVFLDINMLDGTGFDLLDRLEQVDFHLVFITAYDQYAIKAFKYAAFDYLLKPIDLQELRKCIARIESLINPSPAKPHWDVHTATEILQGISSGALPAYKKRFSIKKANGIYLLNTPEIAYFFAEDNLVFAMDKANQKHIVSHRIAELEELLDPDSFFRINRSEIVNVAYIQKMEPYFGNRLVVKMRNGSQELKTSASKTAAFRKWVDQ